MAHGTDPVIDNALERLGALVRRRRDGYPVAYLTGTREFYGRSFIVTPDVLVPRPESELLIEHALKFVAPGDAVVDVGTGSGCLGLTVAAERPGTAVHLVDISAVALSVAADNAVRLSVPGVRLHRADLWPELGLAPEGTVVLANLPYLRDGELSDNRDLRHEPERALAGGRDGLRVIKQLLDELRRRHFQPKALLLEHGPAHTVPLRELMLGHWQTHQDLAGRDRISILVPG